MDMRMLRISTSFVRWLASSGVALSIGIHSKLTCWWKSMKMKVEAPRPLRTNCETSSTIYRCRLNSTWRNRHFGGIVHQVVSRTSDRTDIGGMKGGLHVEFGDISAHRFSGN